MKGIFIKITAVAVFAVVLGGVGIFVANKVSAQTAQDCTSTSPTFWGWIACYIGNPAQGISGTATLFQGQKAIYDKINTGSSAGGNSSGALGADAYLQTGNNASIYLGKLANSGIPNGNLFWGMSAVSACGPMDCPVRSYDTSGNDTVLALFFPSDEAISKYQLLKNRNGNVVKPSLCYVRQKQANSTNVTTQQSQGFVGVDTIVMRCSYFPSICTNYTSLHPEGVYGCMGKADVEKTLYNYSANPTAVADQYRIIIK